MRLLRLHNESYVLRIPFAWSRALVDEDLLLLFGCETEQERGQSSFLGKPGSPGGKLGGSQDESLGLLRVKKLTHKDAALTLIFNLMRKGLIASRFVSCSF